MCSFMMYCVTTLGQRTFSELGTPLAEVPFCVLDLETTGLGPDVSEITEIGAVCYVGGVETGRFQTLVNPATAIPARITVITGISQAMVIEAPRIEEALPAFLEFLGNSLIVGHNVSFDISFLNAAAIRLGYGRLPNRSMDTMRLARRLVRSEVRGLKLSSLAAHFGSPTTPNHRAFDDAMATAHVFWCLLERAGAIGVTHLDDLLALPSIQGSRAIGKLALTEHLPRRPGIYRFINKTGDVIYVGKATNLRSRVRSYFGGDTRRRVDAMLRDLATIEHRTTNAEIEAAVLEIREIHSLKPHYNRRSKPPKSLHWIRLTDEKFPRLQLVRLAGCGLLDVGPFRTRWAAEQVMFALWDGSRIRRCTTTGDGCSHADLGQSVCPCSDEDDGASYGEIVSELRHAIDRDPAPLISGLARKMATFSSHHRFEDAAAVRDRWDALAGALERQRAWRALCEAGTIVARDSARVSLRIECGSMDGCWTDREQEPLPLLSRADVDASHPSSMLDHDEAVLLWKWLERDDVTLVDVTGTLALPAAAVKDSGVAQAISAPASTGRSGRSSTTPPSVIAPMTRTSETKPPTFKGGNPVAATT
jgi:DNA polymerase-3 subunit epsilon